MDSEKAKLIELLDLEEGVDFQLRMLEAIGKLIFMQHWTRGLLNWMYKRGLVASVMKSGELDAFGRVLEKMEAYEGRAWDAAVPRAVVVVLEELRKGQQLSLDAESLVQSDEFGRWDTEDEVLDQHILSYFKELLGG